MPRKSREPYPTEFKKRLVALVRSGRSPEELARQFEPSSQTIRNWVEQASIDGGLEPGMTTAEKEELTRLRREVRSLREDREILRKAAAWFAREGGSNPPKGSSS